MGNIYGRQSVKSPKGIGLSDILQLDFDICKQNALEETSVKKHLKIKGEIKIKEQMKAPSRHW